MSTFDSCLQADWCRAHSEDTTSSASPEVLGAVDLLSLKQATWSSASPFQNDRNPSVLAGGVYFISSLCSAAKIHFAQPVASAVSDRGCPAICRPHFEVTQCTGYRSLYRPRLSVARCLVSCTTCRLEHNLSYKWGLRYTSPAVQPDRTDATCSSTTRVVCAQKGQSYPGSRHPSAVQAWSSQRLLTQSKIPGCQYKASKGVLQHKENGRGRDPACIKEWAALTTWLRMNLHQVSQKQQHNTHSAWATSVHSFMAVHCQV